jgi:hypothetical protein
MQWLVPRYNVSKLETKEMMSQIEEATLEVLKTLLLRPDAPLYTPDELANKAFEYVTAVGRRTRSDESERTAAIQTAMSANTRDTLDRLSADSLRYGMRAVKIYEGLDVDRSKC